ncbi:DUF2341 domain-containing protein [bacterium]|nr:DUF2341 domain-containing protein [bacterium]
MQKSFTLIELLIVIAIIGILFGILIISMTGAINSANDAKRKADIHQLVNTLLAYNASHPSYPISSTACNIGSNCSAEVNAALGNGINARDPSGGYYSYSSTDGTNFIISTIMSDSSTYYYSSSSSKYSISSSGIPGWNKRKPITVSSTSALTDYQIKLVVTYDSDMQADFDDLRFTSSDGKTLLDYWIESKTDSSTATVWVKVPSLISGNTSIFMYYGNTSAVTTSNGSNVFTLFDDFDDGTIDTSKWTRLSYPPTWSESNGKLTISGATINWEYFSTTNAVSDNSIIEANVTQITTTTYGMRLGIGSTLTALAGLNPKANTINVNNSNGAAFTCNTPAIYGFEIRSGTVYVARNRASQTTTSNAPATKKLILAITADDGVGVMSFDWIIARKYATVEPTTIFGSEENV